MFENVAIRILVGVVIIALGFMVLKYVSSADKATPVVEYKAPVDRKKQVVAKLNLPKGILKRSGAPTTQNSVSFAPSAIDGTMNEYGAWDTNRNSSSGIMNNLNSVDALTSGQMVPPMTAPPPTAASINSLTSVPLLDGYSGDDGDLFGSDL
jgi:hypothetical protein